MKPQVVLLVLAGGIVAGTSAAGQEYRARLESRAQSVSFRGVRLDSTPFSATVIAPGGGRETADGFAVRCDAGAAYCYFFRPGAKQTAGPAVTSAGITVWGLGLAGLSLRADARVAVDLGNAEVWPGTAPAVQLLEGYAEYATPRVTGRLGRQVYVSRLGFTGFDGARIITRLASLQLDGYLGWGMGRASALPVNSEALNPLDDFQPRQRQIVAGLAAGLHHRWGHARAEYQREVDPRSDYFVSERLALSSATSLPRGIRAEGGAVYDLAQGLWGSADFNLRYAARRWSAGLGVRRYRPHFELWTVWGAFSPVGYHEINGSLGIAPLRGLSLRARASRFWFEESETETPLVSVEDRGWRVGVRGSYAVSQSLSFDANHETQYAPGGSYASLDGAAHYRFAFGLMLTLSGGRLNRPIEFRFDEATLHFLGIDADWSLSERWRVSLGATHYAEVRDRPDAAGLDWNQTRLSARVSLLLGHEATSLALPPAVRRPAGSP